jgi:hypothetical protein
MMLTLTVSVINGCPLHAIHDTIKLTLTCVSDFCMYYCCWSRVKCTCSQGKSTTLLTTHLTIDYLIPPHNLLMDTFHLIFFAVEFFQFGFWYKMCHCIICEREKNVIWKVKLTYLTFEDVIIVYSFKLTLTCVSDFCMYYCCWSRVKCTCSHDIVCTKC